MLEPCEGKPSCTVLRGESGSNTADLPDQINMFKAEHGTSKCVTWLPESERELQTILRREHVKRDYHAKPGNIQEYMDSLKKGTLRGKLENAKTAAASTRKPPSHKKEPER